MHYVTAKGILSPHNGMNLYRGCQHGCIYCDARSDCYQMNHAFEDIEVKENAIPLLEAALKAKRRPCMIGFGVAIQTKSCRILRDLDLLKSIHRHAKAVVQMTLTTYDDALCRILEPNVSTTRQRLEALKAFRDAGIPTVVWLCPILPFLNDTDENIRAIVEACAEAGVMGIINFGMGVTLRSGDREYFYSQLDRHFPGMKQRYIRTFGNAYEVPSPRSRKLLDLFHGFCQEHGILHDNQRIFQSMRQFPENRDQLSFFDP